MENSFAISIIAGLGIVSYQKDIFNVTHLSGPDGLNIGEACYQDDIVFEDCQDITHQVAWRSRARCDLPDALSTDELCVDTAENVFEFHGPSIA